MLMSSADAAAAPGRPGSDVERDVDVVVLGSGAAGLVSGARRATGAQRARRHQGHPLDAGSTAWAQGGLAGVLDPDDSLENHVRDTLAAGAGLCDEAVVRELVDEAPRGDPLPDAARARRSTRADGERRRR